MTLVERIEALTEPSEEADAHIWNAIYGHDKSWVAQSKFNFKWCVYEKCPRNGERLVENRKAGAQLKDAYTSSLDAALMLFADEETAFRELYEVMCWFATEGPIFKPTIFALNKALCIAALKARGVK
jgi:hypothetical protein